MTKKDFLNLVIQSLQTNHMEWDFGDKSLINIKGMRVQCDPGDLRFITHTENQWVLLLEGVGSKVPMLVKPFFWNFNFLDKWRLKKAVDLWKAERISRVIKALNEVNKKYKNVSH